MAMHVPRAAPASREIWHVVVLVVFGVEFVGVCGGEGIGEGGGWEGASAVTGTAAAVGHRLRVVGSGLVQAVGHGCCA